MKQKKNLEDLIQIAHQVLYDIQNGSNVGDVDFFALFEDADASIDETSSKEDLQTLNACLKAIYDALKIEDRILSNQLEDHPKRLTAHKAYQQMKGK